MEFNVNKAIYRRNNFGSPCVWYAEVLNPNHISISHGIVGKTITKELIRVNRSAEEEVKSRFNAKLKTGYKYITELRDSSTYPVEGDDAALYAYLNAYLPYDRTTQNSIILPMLAKTFDDKVFERCATYIGQYKINGLRCLISAYYKQGDLFNPIGLIFQSREGELWNSCQSLEQYLLNVIPQDVLIDMIENNYVLDGEVYLPGYKVNDINHFVKNTSCKENSLIQYWCYDIIMNDTLQWKRQEYLLNNLHKFVVTFNSIEEHLNNTKRFIVLPHIYIDTNQHALDARNHMIDLGFEGLILRNPNVEYDIGKRRVGVMVKYKKSTDGLFRCTAIYPESIKRPNIPLIRCKNDINDAEFEVHIGGTQSYQRYVLDNKDTYIGKMVFIEFGERSGVNKVPFHVKNTYFVGNR